MGAWVRATPRCGLGIYARARMGYWCGVKPDWNRMVKRGRGTWVWVWGFGLTGVCWGTGMPGAVGGRIGVAVEVEEPVYSYEPANNGAGPMWCSGSTCLVRLGDEVFASGLETLAEVKPLNNCRWTLYRRGGTGWERAMVDDVGRTREPSPIGVFGDGRVWLSANPTLVEDVSAYGGPSRPELIEFEARRVGAGYRRQFPEWKGEPRFTEHSYRSLALDGERGELVLLQNVGHTHAEWAFRDRRGAWSAQGRLQWPWGADYERPEPIRICYPNVALVDRAVYFCGVSDIVEPNLAWRAFKKGLTGREWDYDFRRLFYTWTPDVTKEGFRDWVEVASREATCGWISPGDLRVLTDGSVQVLWTERAIDERLRDRFFPGARQRYALEFAVIRDGVVVRRRTLIEGGEGLKSGEVPGTARFHAFPDGRLWVVCYVSGVAADGRRVSENRVLELGGEGEVLGVERVSFERPFGSFFTATPRAGSEVGDRVDIMGQRVGEQNVIAYARITRRE
jgi:hypothetical protein